MVKTEVILQARMGSSRYPGKMITDISGRTLLSRVLSRLESVMDGVPQILAIPDDSADDPLEEIALSRNWRVFRGSETDVLGRFAGAIREFSVERFVRATGDNPLFDVDGTRSVIKLLDQASLAYGVGYPKGGIFAAAHAKALLEANLETNDPYDREHVMPFLHKHPDRYTFQEHLCSWKGADQYRLTVDTAEDIEQARWIFAELGDDPSFDEIISLLENS